MKNLLFVISILCAIASNAQNFTITFTGTGESNTVSTVLVENLTTGTVTTVNGDDILGLTSTVGIIDAQLVRSLQMKIYPNPMTDESTIEISSPVSGEAIISICEMNGNMVSQLHSYLECGEQQFKLSGLRNGMYLVNVKSKASQYSQILICYGKSKGKPGIEKVAGNVQLNYIKETTLGTKGIKGTVEMEYSSGDIIKFTGISGEYSTVVATDINEDTTIEFNFVACTDGDGNNYPVVDIGGQIWMAENLKTTKYRDGTDIPIVTDGVQWSELSSPAYCWYNNEIANKDIYGALYNWYTADEDNLCPGGWHVPTDEEWTTLITNIGGANTAATKLKETGTTHWMITNPGATDEYGFTALPGGYRSYENGAFIFAGYDAAWWTSTGYSLSDAWFHGISYNYSFTAMFRGQYGKGEGFSVRCINGIDPSLIASEAEINDTLLWCYSKFSEYIEFTYLFDAVYSNHITGPDNTWLDIYNHTQTPFNAKVLKLWSDAYNIIYKANQVIQSAGIVISDQLTRNMIIAQAKAIRSYIYYNLLTWFGEVPLDEGFSESLIPRNTIEEVLAQIKQDASEASQFLPMSWPVSDNFRIPKSFLKGLSARVSLYSKNYTEALATTQEIINSGMYALSIDPANFSSTSTEIFWGFEKGDNTEFNDFFDKGSFVPAIRYTESMIISAEALYNSGSTQNALNYINQLNDRRSLPFAILLSNDDIFSFWDMELAKEGNMFVTLKRFDKALSVVQYLQYKLVLPVPMSVLNNNPFMTQNPGY